MKQAIVVLTIVAAAAMAVTAAAASHEVRVLCGNFGGSGPDPHLSHKPARCNITVVDRGTGVAKLRNMHWSKWGRGIAKGKGKVTGKKRAVRLRNKRPCGQNNEFQVYSEMKIGDKKWRRILYCGD